MFHLQKQIQSCLALPVESILYTELQKYTYFSINNINSPLGSSDDNQGETVY